jgi:hypothetical protein
MDGSATISLVPWIFWLVVAVYMRFLSLCAILNAVSSTFLGDSAHGRLRDYFVSFLDFLVGGCCICAISVVMCDFECWLTLCGFQI